MKIKNKIQISDLQNIVIGRGVQMRYINDSDGQVDLQGENVSKKAILIQALTDIQIKTIQQIPVVELNGGGTDYNKSLVIGIDKIKGEELPAGTYIFGDTFKIELESGIVCLYVVPIQMEKSGDISYYKFPAG